MLLQLLDALNIFRVRLGGRPLLFSIGVIALLLIIRTVRARRRSASRTTGDMRLAARVISCAALIALTGYVSLAFWYASDPHFFDNAEPSIVALGWLFHVGQPTYHTPASAERYAHIYGPMTYMLHGYALGIFGPSIAVSKALGASAGLTSLALVYRAIRSKATPARAVVLTGVFALLLLLFRNYSFWTRPEPLQLAAVSAILLFAVSGRGYMSATLIGLASGILWNLKFTGPLYCLPVFVLLQRRTGWRRTLLAVGVAAAMFLLPFVEYPNVSLANYVAWLHLSSGTGLRLHVLRQNLEWATYFSVPLLLSYYAVPRDLRPGGAEWRGLMIALLIGMAGVVVAGAKPGAGPYHLMPFLPVIMYVIAWQSARSELLMVADPLVPLASISFVLAAFIIALAQQAHLITTMMERRVLREGDDIAQFADTHQGVIEMGYGETEALTLQRPALVFRSNSYFLDQPALREHQLAGIDLPQATIEALAGCRVNYWLIPKGEEPFSGRNSYAAVFSRPLFSEDFRQAFHASHILVSTTVHYDVWKCQAKAGT